MKLTAKQKKFALEYIDCGNATEAAIRAGYSKKTARFIGAENLSKPHIKAYIDAKMEELESAKLADAKEVLQFLTRVIRCEEKETVVVTTELGIETVEKEADIKTRVTAAKELLKRFPAANDELQKAIVDKARADADIARFKADSLKGSDDEQRVIIVDDF